MTAVESAEHVQQPEYTLRHFGCAAFLMYVMSDEAHLATIKTDRGWTFVFADDGTIRQSVDAFFSEQGAAVANAFQLMECGRALKGTIAEALANQKGAWQRS